MCVCVCVCARARMLYVSDLCAKLVCFLHVMHAYVRSVRVCVCVCVSHLRVCVCVYVYVCHTAG